VRRHILGLVTLASFALAAITSWYAPLAPYQPLAAMALRFGLVLGVFWLAWPDLHRLPRWLWYALPIGLVVVFFARAYLFLLLPTFVVALGLYLFYRKVWRSHSR
jgi:hypothetical protein